MKNKLQIICFLALLLSAVTAFGQDQQITEADRERWLQTIREHKHEFLAKELDLSKEQQKEFFPLYDQMEDEIERISSETRDIERRLNDNSDAEDIELENGARTIFEERRAEGQVEMTYFDKFREILSPRQLVKLKTAERKFNQQLMNRHRRLMNGHSGRKK